MLRTGLIGITTVALATAGCGSDTTTTPEAPAPPPPPTTSAADEAALEATERAAEFCVSPTATKIEVALKSAKDASYAPSGVPKDPREAAKQLDLILKLAEKAPPGAACAITALEEAANIYKADRGADGTRGLQEVRDFQRENDLTPVDQ